MPRGKGKANKEVKMIFDLVNNVSYEDGVQLLRILLKHDKYRPIIQTKEYVTWAVKAANILIN